MNDYGTYQTTSYTSSIDIRSQLLAIFGGYLVGLMVIGVIMIIAMWKIFRKAGKPGWAAIVPIYNIIVLLQIVELPLWYLLLFFIPLVNIFAIFRIYIALAHKFGKSTGFGVLSVFFGIICLPILAFGKAQYEGGEYQSTNSSTDYNRTNRNIEQTPIPAQEPGSVRPADMWQTSVASHTNPMPRPEQQVQPTQPSQVQQPVQPSQVQQPVQPTQSTQAQQPRPVQEPMQKICPNCGASTTADTCFLCGHKF